MIERLIFGCGRLTGGATEREALGLLDLCLTAGIRHFDTAPSYGLGTAETVVGKALRGAGSAVRVTAKVGSLPPRHGWAKTWLRLAKRRMTADAPRLSGRFAPVEPEMVQSAADFSSRAMAASAARSLDRLGRIDWLLLHEALRHHAVPAVLSGLETLAAPLGALPGYSNGALFESATDAAFPAGWVAQTALRPEWLAGTPPPRPRTRLSLHSIALTGQWLADHDPAFAAKAARAVTLIDGTDPAAQRIALYFALAAARLPEARLIVSSSHAGRLRSLLGLLATLDPPHLRAIAAVFDDA